MSTTTVAVASADTGAATVDVASLTFTTQNWSTAQTVTVTAQADDDPRDEETTITLSAAGVGTLATVAVTVADDDAGTVLIDADPATTPPDPGPLLLAEGDSAGYAVRLSAAPTGDGRGDGDQRRHRRGDGGHGLADVHHDELEHRRRRRPPPRWRRRATRWTSPCWSPTRRPAAATAARRRTCAWPCRTPERTGTDYDVDNDGLIEVSTLAQLSAIRWDLDGDGSPASNAANYSGASGAFASASAGMGCPAVNNAATCTGYELTQDLDFDTDGDGSTHTRRHQRLGRHLPQRRRRLGSHRPQRVAHRQHPLQRRLRRQRPFHPQPVHQPQRAQPHGAWFAVLRGNAVVRALGLPNAYVGGALEHVRRWSATAGAAPRRCGPPARCAGHGNVGGLHGVLRQGGTIVASYSTASAECTGTTTHAGGLVGQSESTLTSGGIVASYATGAVTGACPAGNKHGLVGGAGTVVASHWDRETSGVTTSAGGAGRTTAQLKTPTSATGIFAGWADLDVDSDGDPHESPWHFGTSSQYPALSYRGMDPVVQRGDYDLDDDGLIEIRTLTQLNAVRWDLDGDGTASTGNVGGYAKAFRNHDADMGCPTLGGCEGYELENDLDFDTDGDGSTWTDDGTFAADSGDAYHNSGNGWDPIGPASAPNDTTHFTAVFDGNGKVVANLLVNRFRNYSGLFAALRPGAEVRALGLPNALVRNGQGSVAPLAGVVAGRVAAVWASGSAAGQTNVGGLVGVVESGATVVASYSTASASCESGNRIAGGFAAANSGAIAASYSTGAVTGGCPTANKYGFASGSGTFTATYWDVNRSGIADDTGTASPEGETLREPAHPHRLRGPLRRLGRFRTSTATAPPARPRTTTPGTSATSGSGRC